MNGPFAVADFGCAVVDASRAVIAQGYSFDGDEQKERAHAEMISDALNAVYYAAKAPGSSS